MKGGKKLAYTSSFDYKGRLITMAQKTRKDLLAEKRATALRENLKRRKEAQHQQDKKTEKK